MSGILDLLNSAAGKQIVNGIAGQTGQDAGAANNVLTMALPVMMQAMRKNASTPDGAAGLMSALQNKHDGSILDNLDGLFAGGVNDDVLQDGGKILGHMLGGKQQNVQNALSKQSGIDAGSVAQIMQVAAPIVMGMLGKQSRENSVAGASGLEGLLGGLVQGNSPEASEGFLNAILDADGDGSVVDDVAGMLLGGKKKGGLGNMLGNILGN